MLILLLAACTRPAPPPPTVAFRVDAVPSVAFRQGAPLPTLGPDARTDKGLQAAAEELASVATTPDARLAPTAVRVALGRAGYPGDAHFVRVIGGGTEPPAALLDAVPRGAPVDVAWAWRDLPDGRRWWVLGWAWRRIEMDALPRDVALDAGISLRVDRAIEPRLIVGQPDGGVVEMSIVPGKSRWIDVFHVPGEYRIEVVDQDRVELLFSVYADQAPPPPSPLPGAARIPDLFDAQRTLYAELTALRARNGLPPLPVYGAFEPLARAHATCLASTGEVAHTTPRCPGVPAMAGATYTPHARHHEDVAAGDTAAEAWERLLDSPAHRLNLLCRTCSHAAIGVAAEPTVPSRLFVVWELLEFPDGMPTPIPRNR